MNRRARLAVATVLAGLGFGLMCAPGASALTISGCEIKPGTNCPGADLRGADLNHAHLRGANLSGAKLGGTRLNHANLISANLSGASAAGASFSFADLGLANLKASDLSGASFHNAILGKADFTSANVSGGNFVHAHFAETRFNSAKIQNAIVVPSNIDHDRFARHFFFQGVYTHVNAYGNYGSCHGERTVVCTGENDDPRASPAFREGVHIQWGSFESSHNVFEMWASHKHTRENALHGTTNSNLGDFYVHRIGGAFFQDLGPTQRIMQRGHPGGPIALGIHHHSGFNSGYSINVSGWLPRLTNAPQKDPAG